MWFIVGLGNPGPERANQRHNLGFNVVDILKELCDKSSEWVYDSSIRAYTCEAVMDEQVIKFVKPLTGMNQSGDSVGKLMSVFTDAVNSEIIVIHDEMEIAMGDVRCKIGGGHAGHNGLKSIDAAIGEDYYRIRVGMGRPATRDEVAHYVESDFAPHEIEAVNKTRDLAARVTIVLMLEGLHKAQQVK